MEDDKPNKSALLLKNMVLRNEVVFILPIVQSLSLTTLSVLPDLYDVNEIQTFLDQF